MDSQTSPSNQTQSPTTQPADSTQPQPVQPQPVQELPDQPDPTSLGLKDPYTAKIPKQAMGLQLAHRAMMIDDAQQILAADRARMIAFDEKMLGLTSQSQAGSQSPEDNNMIHVGDITNHYQLPAQPAAQTSAAQSQSQPAAPSPVQAAATGLSNLAKAGILAATLGSGAALPLGASALANYFSKPTTSAATPAQPQANQGFMLRVVPNEEDGSNATGS